MHASYEVSMNLFEQYGISKFESTYLEAIRKIRGTSNPPEWLYKHSRKKYGWEDNLCRYWYDRYVGIPVGKFTYGYQFVKSPELHSIGSFCSIGVGQNIVGNGHNIEYVSSYGVFVAGEHYMPCTDRSIIIGNDVWIGAHSVIRSGVNIGHGAVIGAGSVITKDVAPFAVVVGANRVVKQRFSDDIVEELLSMEWWNWENEKIFESMKYWSDVTDFIQRYKYK